MPCRHFDTQLPSSSSSSSLVDFDPSPELLVLVADELDHLGVHLDLLIHSDGERLGIGLWIIDRNVDLEPAKTRPSIALANRCLIRQRAAAHIEPAVISEVVRLGDERVTVPMTNRISIPPRRRIALLR